MKITCHYRNDPERGLTDPLPEKEGRALVFRLYSGDWLDPINITLFTKYNWFTPPFPPHVLHLRVPVPILPFIAWRYPDWFPFVGGKAGYIGFKVYGVDAEPYKQWLCDPAEVYDGSQAVCFSLRPFASIK